MATLLGKSLDDSFWIRREDPITTKDSEPEPDLSVVAGPEASHPAHPTTAKLVVEISVSTLVDDREMAAIYAEAGVEEYWIVTTLKENNAVAVPRLQGKGSRLCRRFFGECGQECPRSLVAANYSFSSAHSSM